MVEFISSVQVFSTDAAKNAMSMLSHFDHSVLSIQNKINKLIIVMFPQ